MNLTDPTTTATSFLDHESAEVREFVNRALPSTDLSPTDKAVRLYYAVRDGVRYDVYGADLSRDGVRASSTIRRGSGFCIHKSIAYAAAVRAAGIPSRLVLADVRNHLASERLKWLVGGDIFRFHCLTAVHLNGAWVRATPVFNLALCRLYGITPLEFDGRTDSVLHPYDSGGRRSMEVVRWHGEFDDFPYDLVLCGLSAASPRLFARATAAVAGSLEHEAPVPPEGR